jgi:multidrug resistance efflux pump
VKDVLDRTLRFGLTAVAVVAAVAVGMHLWAYYMDAPWTRDGHVRADVVQVAPDVSGFVTDVLVHDNQRVQRGDVIFRIDRARFELALRQGDAIVAGRRSPVAALRWSRLMPTSIAIAR